MDKNQKVNLAKAKKAKANELERERQAEEARRFDTVEAFVRQLSDVVEGGIEIEGLDSLSVACDRIEKFGDTVKTLIENIAKHADSFSELEIPDQLTVNHVTDDLLLAKLEQVGDNGQLLQQLQAIDEALVLLTASIEKIKEQGKRPQDYLPVRLVEGWDDSLKFVHNLNFGGGSGGGTANGLTDAQLRASPVPVSASIDTTGLATETKQDTLIGHVDGLEALVTSTNTKLDTLNTSVGTIVSKATDAYSVSAISEDATYKYFFFEDSALNYYVMRKHKTNQVYDYTKGTGGYASVYVSSTAGPSGSPTWASYGTTF
jgi:hypothetical protein